MWWYVRPWLCDLSLAFSSTAQNTSTTQSGNVTVPVRLAGSSQSYQGRVEVYFGGSWGTVCDDFWDMADARVVCRQLGFPGAWAYVRRAYFGQGTRVILMDNVNCLGTEAQLADCTFSGWGNHDCSHSEDAGVVCGKVFAQFACTDAVPCRYEVGSLFQLSH